MILAKLEIVKAGYSKFIVAMLHAAAPKLRGHPGFLKPVPVCGDPWKLLDAQRRKSRLVLGLHCRTGYKKQLSLD